MSKMSELAMELDDCAMGLGFESYEEALEKGYRVNYDKRTLEPDIDQAYEDKHQEWAAERDTIVGELEMLKNDTPYIAYKEALTRAIEFLRRCHD